MPEDDVGDETRDDVIPVFTDTCVLLNYVQRGLEPDHTSHLIDGDAVAVVVGVTVVEELDQLNDRRADIYTDFVDFLLNEDGKIDEYDPYERRPYFQNNDVGHIRDIQMRLSQLDDRAEVLRELRQLTRMFERRFKFVQSELVPASLFEDQPGMTVLFAVGDVIDNDNDRNVVADAALWAAEGEESSGVFVTMDREHLLEAATEINEALSSVRGTDWQLTFYHPRQLTSEEMAHLTAEADRGPTDTDTK